MSDFKIVDWLGQCCLCGHKHIKVIVTDDSSCCKVKTLDKVWCDCGNTGYVDVMDGNAFVCWDEQTEDELKYNKLKVRFDKAVELLMLSDYGDVRYLTQYGILEKCDE